MRCARLAVAAVAVATLAGCSSSTAPTAEQRRLEQPRCADVDAAAAPAPAAPRHPSTPCPGRRSGPAGCSPRGAPSPVATAARSRHPASQVSRRRPRRCTSSTRRAAATRSRRSRRRATARTPDWSTGRATGPARWCTRRDDEQGTVDRGRPAHRQADLVHRRRVRRHASLQPAAGQGRAAGQVAIDVDSPASLRRVDLTGKPQLTYPVDKLGSEFNAALPLQSRWHAIGSGHQVRSRPDGQRRIGWQAAAHRRRGQLHSRRGGSTPSPRSRSPAATGPTRARGCGWFRSTERRPPR